MQLTTTEILPPGWHWQRRCLLTTGNNRCNLSNSILLSLFCAAKKSRMWSQSRMLKSQSQNFRRFCNKAFTKNSYRLVKIFKCLTPTPGGRPRRGFKSQGQPVFFPSRAKQKRQSPEEAVWVETIVDHHISMPLCSFVEIRRRCWDIQRQSRHFWLGKSKIFRSFWRLLYV